MAKKKTPKKSEGTRRGKMLISSELLSQFIFGRSLQHIEIVKDNDTDLFTIFMKDPSLDIVPEGVCTPRYILDEDKDLTRIIGEYHGTI